MNGLRPESPLRTLMMCLLISLAIEGAGQDATPEAPAPDQTKLGAEMLKNGSFDTFIVNGEEAFRGKPSDWKAAPAALVVADYFDPERLCVVELSPDPKRYVNLQQEVLLPNTPDRITISVDVFCGDTGKVALTLIALLADDTQKRLVTVDNKQAKQWETLAARIEFPKDLTAKKMVFRVSQRPDTSQAVLVNNASMRLE